MKNSLPWFALLFLMAFTKSSHSADAPIVADILLRNGTIVDGSGAPASVGDVAIHRGRIVGVGQFELARAERTLDCTNLIIAPGFIDLHTHSDDQVISHTMRGCVNYLMQGCTTCVTGNCGAGPVDMAAYHAKIDLAGASTNVAHLLPQGSLRERVIGKQDRPPTVEELQRMRDLADNAMRDGAWGMSTGLIYVPSVYAKTDELIEIAKVVASHRGIYASHIRGEGRDLLEAVHEAIQIGQAAKIPVHISHFKASGTEHWGLIRQAATVIEQARATGQFVTADQYPYTASSTSLEATVFPTWARAGGTKDFMTRLDDPEQGPRIRESVTRQIAKCNEGAALFIARCKYRPAWVGKNLKQIADEEQRSAVEIAIDIARHDGASIVNFSMSEDDVRYAMQLPWVATASDGRFYLPGADRPHPRSYGTFARKVGYYAIREKVISLEHAIRSASGLPADIIGFTDRGYLRPEYAADIVVFAADDFIDTATFQEPHRYSKGLRHSFVNGIPTIHEGQPTGALAGKALKHESTAK